MPKAHPSTFTGQFMLASRTAPGTQLVTRAPGRTNLAPQAFYPVAKPIPTPQGVMMSFWTKFQKQFPLVAAMPEPKRTEILKAIDEALFGYLTKIGKATMSTKLGGLVRYEADDATTSWAFWADWLDRYAASVDPAARSTISAVARMIRNSGNGGLYAWNGPWPSFLTDCRASYNDWIRKAVPTADATMLPYETKCR